MSDFEASKHSESRPVEVAQPLHEPHEILRIMGELYGAVDKSCCVLLLLTPRHLVSFKVPQGSPPGSDLNVRTEGE